jgi:putative membrane protein
MASGMKEGESEMSSQSIDSPAKDRGTVLAEERTDVALDRTRMAAERTLMAWVRTTLSMISFGFTIFKFFQYLQQAGAAAQWRPEMPKNLGLFLVILGTGMLVLAVVQHWVFLRQLKERSGKKLPVSLALIAAFFITLMGFFALANLIFKIGGF